MYRILFFLMLAVIAGIIGATLSQFTNYLLTIPTDILIFIFLVFMTSPWWKNIR